MPALSNAQVAALELEKVLPTYKTLFDRDDKFYSRIAKKNVQKMSNRQMRVPLEMAPGGSFGYFDPDGGDMGRGSAQEYDKAVLQCVFLSEAIEYTKLAEWGTDDSRKAIVNAVRELSAKAFDEFRRQLDSAVMGDGTGVIGTVTSDTPAAGDNVIVCTTDGFGIRLMRQNQTVQIFDVTLATNRGSAVVTYYDLINNTIHLTPQIAGVIATDLIVTNGISAPAATPALYGVAYHDSNASTGTWLGFNRAATPQVRASGTTASSSALTLPLPRLAINNIGNRVGIDNDFNPAAWMHPCQAQAYEEIGQLVSQIYKDPKEQKLDMYFDGMQMAGAPVMKSFSWDKTRIDFITEGNWGRGEILPLGYYTTDDRKIFELRGPSGGIMTADIFYLVLGTQTFVGNPAAGSYIYSLAVPPGY